MRNINLEFHQALDIAPSARPPSHNNNPTSTLGLEYLSLNNNTLSNDTTTTGTKFYPSSSVLGDVHLAGNPVARPSSPSLTSKWQPSISSAINPNSSQQVHYNLLKTNPRNYAAEPNAASAFLYGKPAAKSPSSSPKIGANFRQNNTYHDTESAAASFLPSATTGSAVVNNPYGLVGDNFGVRSQFSVLKNFGGPMFPRQPSPVDKSREGKDASVYVPSYSSNSRTDAYPSAIPIAHNYDLSSVGRTPIGASAYSSLTQSSAVSFLSQVAESTVCSNLSPGKNWDEGDMVGRFVLGKVIGLGNFAECREAFADDADIQFAKCAVKVVKHHGDINNSGYVLFDKEVSLWRKLNHPNIIRLIEVIDTEDAKFAFCELAENGNLLDYITKHGPFKEHEIRIMVVQMLDAMFHLHEEIRVVHRDIKPENILLDSDMNIKLCDVGLAEYISDAKSGREGNEKEGENEKSFCAGTFAYCSPEELNDMQGSSYHIDPKSDVWSLGVVLYAMATSNLPFSDDFPPRLQLAIMRGEYEPLPMSLSAQCRDFIHSMLLVDKNQRPSTRELKCHPWLLQ